MSECICMSPLNRIKSTHSNNRNIDLIVMTQANDEGIVLLENNIALACFDINYCPICGRELKAGRASQEQTGTPPPLDSGK